jgi:hypothetical protein
VYNLIAVTLEQYVEIIQPLWFKTRLKCVKAKQILLAVWLIAITYNIAYSVPDTEVRSGRCLAFAVFPNAAAAGITGVSMLLYYYILPATIMIGCLYHMGKLLRRRARKTAPTCANATFRRARANVVKTLFLFLVTMAVCWSCATLIYLQAFFHHVDADFFTTWPYHVSIVIFLLSTSAHPLIYAVHHKKFKVNAKIIVRAWFRGLVSLGSPPLSTIHFI